MDGSTFDKLTRVVSTAGSRRYVLGLLASLGLGGVLSTLDGDDAAAKRKRNHHPGKRKEKRQRRRKSRGNGGKGGNGVTPSPQCAATGSDCAQDSDCCTNNCFNLTCAEKAHTCGGGSNPQQCVPPAKGCGGNTCCYGAVACSGNCCSGAANQCNPQGECCAPNCAGKQCGADGCGAGGTCGTCPSGSTCDEDTGQCHSTCVPQCQGKTCGPDGCGGVCGTCNADSVCHQGTCQRCDVCPSCTFTSVQAALDSGQSTIHICPGTYNESLLIERGQTVIGYGQGTGPGDTIIRSPGGRVISTLGAEGPITLRGLHITGGTTSPEDTGGCGVDQDGGHLTLIDCTVTGNNGGGSAIATDGDSLTLKGCTVSNNRVFASETVRGGGISVIAPISTLTDCVITGNSADAGGDFPDAAGGGLYYFTGTHTISNTSVTDNSTNGDSAGGGIWAESGTVSVTLVNGSVVSDNQPNNCAGPGPIIGCSS